MHPLAQQSPGRRALVALMLALVVAFGLSACGSSSNSSSNSAGAVGGTQYQARLSLAKCFRAHGVNVPDPSTNGGVAGGGGVFRELRNYSQAQIQSATQACRQYFAQAFPRLNLSPAQQAQFRQQLTKFTECMRSHKINIPDPTAGSGPLGLGFGLRGALRSIDRNSPAFQSALTACQSLRPRLGPGGPGGPGGPPPGGGAPGA